MKTDLRGEKIETNLRCGARTLSPQNAHAIFHCGSILSLLSSITTLSTTNSTTNPHINLTTDHHSKAFL